MLCSVYYLSFLCSIFNQMKNNLSFDWNEIPMAFKTSIDTSHKRDCRCHLLRHHPYWNNKISRRIKFKDKLDPVLILALRAPKQILVINKMKILGSDPQAPTRVLSKYPRVPPSRPLLGGGGALRSFGVCLKWEKGAITYNLKIA